MEPFVRQFEDRDEDAVVDLSLKAWEPVFLSLEATLGQDIYIQMVPDWRAHQAGAVREACREEAMHVWVAELDSVVAGFVAVRLDHKESTGEMYMIAVDPEFQSKGVGSALISVALEWFTEHGMALAMVETGGDPGHAPARRAYEKAGFVKLPIARYFMKL